MKLNPETMKIMSKIDLARQLVELGISEEAKAALEREFPELKESEDERIRQMIENTLRDAVISERISKTSYREMSTYLEKQKDAIGAARQQGYEEGLEDGIKMNMAKQMGESKEWADELSAEIDRISKRYPEVLFAKLNRVAIHFVRWQKEQKPSTEETELNSIAFLEQMGYTCIPPGAKPAGWSDTDMKEARVNLISVCRDWERGKQTTLLPIVAVRARFFLEHLTEPKPAEWSEEDENKIESIKGLITTGKFVDTNTIRTIWKLLDSLRPQPHWKPSEEQMEVLLNTEGLVRANNYPENAKILASLYEQLKKL